MNPFSKNKSYLISFITLCSMMLYFGIMSATGLVYNTGFRALNLIFLAGGVFWMMHEFKKDQGNDFHYFRGVRQGLTFVFRTILAYSVAIWIVLEFFNPYLMDRISQVSLLEGHMSPFLAALIVFIEGMVSGLLMTFASLQWYKRPMKQFLRAANNENKVAKKPA